MAAYKNCRICGSLLRNDDKCHCCDPASRPKSQVEEYEEVLRLVAKSGCICWKSAADVLKRYGVT